MTKSLSEMTDDDIVYELYGMVQQQKLLLMQWQRTSKLTVQELRELRRNTQLALHESSTRLVLGYTERHTDD